MGTRAQRETWKMDSDEFRGMPHLLHLCEGARVLLTHSEWGLG